VWFGLKAVGNNNNNDQLAPLPTRIKYISKRTPRRGYNKYTIIVLRRPGELNAHNNIITGRTRYYSINAYVRIYVNYVGYKTNTSA